MHTETSSSPLSSPACYSDADLREFQDVIQNKLKEARAQYAEFLTALTNSGEEADGHSAKGMMEANSEQMEREDLAMAAQRAERFIRQLEAAEVRVRTKRYGICSVTGQLIPKQRLLLVPHTTQCVEAKQGQRNAA
jgi:DnaK suppressor protein